MTRMPVPADSWRPAASTARAGSSRGSTTCCRCRTPPSSAWRSDGGRVEAEPPPAVRAMDLAPWLTADRRADCASPRPLGVAGVQSMAAALQATQQDAKVYEAFVLDTADAAIANYSNARLFILQQAGLTDFADLCLGEHQAKAREVQTHRVGFYRYSVQQSPPVDAFFLQDTASGGELGYEVIDFLHGQLTLPYVRPNDLQPAESDYLDRVARSMATLNLDLDRETQSPSPPGALADMRQDFQRITADLPIATPYRLIPYRDGRVQRFLQNYDLILTAEESAALGQSGQAIHSTAYQEHRRYYYQESRVARLIGYLYLQQPGQVFTDDELSTVNWAVF